MVPFKNIFYYFSVYRKYIGNRLYLVFFLALLAALVDGLGISLLLPVVTLLDVGEGGAAGGTTGQATGEPTALESFLFDLLGILGIENSVVGILGFIALVFVVKGLIKFAESGYLAHLQAQLMEELRTKLFDAYSTMDYPYYSRRNTGHFVNLINEQIHALVLSFGKFKQFIATLITVTAYFGFALMMSWKFASMALVAGIVVLFVFRRLSQYVRRLSRRMAQEYGSLNHFMVQTMQAFKYIAATAQIAPLRTAIMRSIRDVSSYKRKQGVAGAFTDSVREPLAVTVLVGLLLLQLAVLGEPVAPILVAVVLIYRAMGRMVGLQSTWQATMSQVGSLEIVEKEFERVSANQQVSGPRTIGPLEESIEFDEVWFTYDEEDQVLRNINLTIQADETVAFVGESGAGKSTLVDLITLLLRPQRGEIWIDGVRHSEIDVSSWREQIGYVSQETVVFDDTIANNISLWRGEYDSDPDVRRRVRRAAEQAYALEFIEKFPEGFRTRVGDRGVRLSGGQRQRLFIARELYKEPRLLILDEATSDLDSESEKGIKESVDDLRGSTTVVMIAHRLSTIKEADHVYVLEDGRIVEDGTYDELIGVEEGTFKRMVELQTL